MQDADNFGEKYESIINLRTVGKTQLCNYLGTSILLHNGLNPA